jgi:hypothetical protein
VANWIERISEPRRLFLAWQAPDPLGERFRWAVGLIEPDGGEIALRYLLPGAEFERWNQGKEFDELERLGYQGYPAFSLKREIHREGVLAAFMRRLPPRTRPDFEEYKRQFRLSELLHVSDFGLLAVTEAKLPNDGFSLVDPLDASLSACDLMLEVAGYRHYAEKLELREGDAVRLEPEPTNPKDPNAIVVQGGKKCVGYINRLQTATFLHWLKERHVTAVVERLNGRADKPRAFIFVQVRPARISAAA